MPYLALTAGSIHATLQKARKPKEIWAASYVFSWLMRELLLCMKNAGFDILSPHYRDLKDDEKFGAGIVPDRIFCRGEAAQLDTLQKLVDDTIASFSVYVAERTGVSELRLGQYFHDYFRFYSLAWEDDAIAGEEIVGRLNQYLDVLELQPTAIRVEQPYFQNLFKRINNSFLVRDAYGKTHPIIEDNGRFPSLPEFAAAGLKKIDAERFAAIKKFLYTQNDGEEDTKYDEDKIILTLKDKFPNEFRVYHKYIAIVKADGDSFGKTLEAIGNRPLPEKPDKPFGLLQFFDECMFEFGVAAAKQIHDFGGNPVYIGGDDLLFFAPVAIEDDNIFNLCHRLDDLFQTEVLNKMTQKRVDIAPTLSFGIHLCYAKFPLYEALNDAEAQLKLAKNENFHQHKNTLAFSLRKHSGAVIQTAFTKNPGASWAAFRELVNQQTFGGAAEYFNSIAHKLDIIGKLMDDPGTDDRRLEAFFNNQFNEDIHQQNEDFTERLQAFILHLKSEYGDSESILPKIKRARQFSAPMEKLYAALRFIQFINSKDDKNDRIPD